jgi:hypothetical protein
MIIGISGLIGSGKSTVANILINNYNFRRLSFADSLKDVVSTVFCWPRELLEGTTEESRKWREEIDTWWANKLDIPNLTPRWVLQYWGTDLCRNNFHQYIWIASMEKKLINLNNNNNYVLPDTRFPNEINLIKSLNGKAWLVKRGNNPNWLTHYIELDVVPTEIHPSEWLWAKSDFDNVIENNSSLEDLRNKIGDLLI